MNTIDARTIVSVGERAGCRIMRQELNGPVILFRRSQLLPG